MHLFLQHHHINHAVVDADMYVMCEHILQRKIGLSDVLHESTPANST